MFLLMKSSITVGITYFYFMWLTNLILKCPERSLPVTLSS